MTLPAKGTSTYSTMITLTPASPVPSSLHNFAVTLNQGFDWVMRELLNYLFIMTYLLVPYCAISSSSSVCRSCGSSDLLLS
jgi:hypothetical protein